MFYLDNEVEPELNANVACHSLSSGPSYPAFFCQPLRLSRCTLKCGILYGASPSQLGVILRACSPQSSKFLGMSVRKLAEPFDIHLPGPESETCCHKSSHEPMFHHQRQLVQILCYLLQHLGWALHLRPSHQFLQLLNSHCLSMVMGCSCPLHSTLCLDHFDEAFNCCCTCWTSRDCVGYFVICIGTSVCLSIPDILLTSASFNLFPIEVCTHIWSQ